MVFEELSTIPRETHRSLQREQTQLDTSNMDEMKNSEGEIALPGLNSVQSTVIGVRSQDPGNDEMKIQEISGK